MKKIIGLNFRIENGISICEFTVPETDIILVLKESLIVGTHIQSDWKGLVRFDTRKSRVEGKFAHGDAHT